MNEFEIIDWIRNQTPDAESVPVGPGDDCACIRTFGRDIAVSTDSLAEGIHFLTNTPPRRIGWKAVASSLSDLAACGCSPLAVVIAAQIPSGKPDGFLRELFEGAREVCTATGVPIAGGDLSLSESGVGITVTSIGSVPSDGMVLRSGAAEGDMVFVTGSVGGSLQGRHLEFLPRIRESLRLRELCSPSAMIDISDGLFSELSHISRESGVGMRIELGNIPISESVQSVQKQRYVQALTDGEDYELLFTVPESEAVGLSEQWDLETQLTCIGVCTGKSGEILFSPESLGVSSRGLKGFSHDF